MSRIIPRVLVAFLLFVLTLSPALVFAQTAIAYDQVVTGQISNEVPEVSYTFQGTAGDTLLIRMTATQQGLDSYLQLLGPSGETLYTDDDGGGNLNAVIGPYTLPQDGVYTIVATRCCGQNPGGSIGTFELVINRAEVAHLTLGQEVTVDLNDQQPAAYFSYDVTEPQLLSITGQLVEGNTDFTVAVRDPQGGYITQLFGGLTGPVILDPLVLNTPGSYLLIVRRESQNPSIPAGPIRVSLVAQPIEAQPLALDTPIGATLDDANPADHYLVTANAGDWLRIEGSQSGGDTAFEVQIIGPQGYFLNSANTAFPNEGGSFVIDPQLIDTTGNYLLVVRRFNSQGPSVAGTTSAYLLTAKPTQTAQLTTGTEVTGTVTPPINQQVYRFEGTAGQTVRLTLRSVSGSYGPSLDIQAPGPAPTGIGGGEGIPSMGTFIFGGNSAVGGTLTYEFTLPATGIYMITVRNGAFAPEGPVAGDYALLIEVVS